MQVVASSAKDLAFTLLRSELHSGSAGAVVLNAADCLTQLASDMSNTDMPDAPPVLPTTGIDDARPWLEAMRNVLVWRVPAEGTLSPRFDGFVGGCIGPARLDVDWTRDALRAVFPGIGVGGLTALSSRISDSRNVAAMATVSLRMADGRGIGLDEACAYVARSFSEASGASTSSIEPSGFDPRLLLCDDEGGMLLERAGHVAQHGGRVLAWGPPGGGKSAFARAQAERMGGPIVTVTPAVVLARPWDATERPLAELWERAATERAVLVVDELDSLCGVRDSSGGNADLVRCLTDEWIPHLDAHPSVRHRQRRM